MMKRSYLIVLFVTFWFSMTNASQLVLIDQQQLKLVKSGLNKQTYESDYWRSFTSVVAQDLKMEALSVTLSAPLSTDGDIHDYYSVGPYWWPNENTKNGLPWVKIDGERNFQFRGEYSDNKMFYRLASAVFRLSLAYYLTGEQQYADKTQLLISHWFLDSKTAMNANLNFGQGVPGIRDGRPYGIIEFRHLLLILDSVSLIQPAADETFQQGFNIWSSQFLNWLTTSEIGQEQAEKHNNHGSYYDALVAGLHIFLGQEQKAKNVFLVTQKRIVEQISQQGLQSHELERTRPYHYSAFNLLAFTQIATMADKLGVDLWHYPSKQDPRILTAFNYLLDNADKPEMWQGRSEAKVNLRHMVVPALRINRFLPVDIQKIINHESSHQELTMCQLLFNYSTPASLTSVNTELFTCTL